MSIKKGSTVWLKSGGVQMTVDEIQGQDDNEALCVWQLSGEHREHRYELESLT